MREYVTVIPGFAAIIVGVLAISAVVVTTGPDTLDPPAVNTSADANQLLAEAFTRLQSNDHELTRTFHNENSAVYYVEYYAISYSEKRKIIGLRDEGELNPSKYFNDGTLWVSDVRGNWEIDSQLDWGSSPNIVDPVLTKPEAYNGTNASVVKRANERITIELRNVEELNVQNHPYNDNSSKWTLLIDANTGNINQLNATYDDENGGKLSHLRYEYEYDITVDRPAGLPFSVEEFYYRFLAMDLSEQLGLVGSLLLVIFGSVVLYLEYPLHRKLR